MCMWLSSYAITEQQKDFTELKNVHTHTLFIMLASLISKLVSAKANYKIGWLDDVW